MRLRVPHCMGRFFLEHGGLKLFVELRGSFSGHQANRLSGGCVRDTGLFGVLYYEHARVSH